MADEHVVSNTEKNLVEASDIWVRSDEFPDGVTPPGGAPSPPDAPGSDTQLRPQTLSPQHQPGQDPV